MSSVTQGIVRRWNQQLTVGRIAPNKVSSVSIGTGMMTLARQMYGYGRYPVYQRRSRRWRVTGMPGIGYRVPQTLAIAGFHGLEIGQVVSPRLASVLTPRAEMGKVATEILIKKIKGYRLLRRSTCTTACRWVKLSKLSTDHGGCNSAF
jgi:hypothetical protein